MNRLDPWDAYKLSPGNEGALKGDLKTSKEKALEILSEYKTGTFHTYFACTLRTAFDFIAAENRARDIESYMSQVIPNFRLAYPGGLWVPQCEEESPSNAKGRFERMLLGRSLTGFVDFVETETWGKIAEAMTLRLLFNSPVVILAFGKTYNMLHDVHPFRVVGNKNNALGFHA